jgi:thymidylate synthase
MNLHFENAQEAFEKLYFLILDKGKTRSNTKYLRNVLIVINNPNNNHINTTWRKWSLKYANIEWQWYLKATRSIESIKDHAKMWSVIQDENGEVNSNYGWQWNRSNQIDYVINELKRDINTRRAVLTIYDAKENHIFKKDTPCTLSIHFDVEDNRLNMNVVMRSNDLVYGFCYDQYCFSKLQEMIAEKLNISIGEYSHFVHNLHIYEKHYDLHLRNKIVF